MASAMQYIFDMGAPATLYDLATEAFAVLRIEACMIVLAIASYFIFFRDAPHDKSAEDEHEEPSDAQRPSSRAGKRLVPAVIAIVVSILVVIVAPRFGGVFSVNELVKMAIGGAMFGSTPTSDLTGLASWAAQQSIASEDGPAIVHSDAQQSLQAREASEALNAMDSCNAWSGADLDLASATAEALCLHITCQSEANRLHLQNAQKTLPLNLAPNRAVLTSVGDLVMRCGALTREMEALRSSMSEASSHLSRNVSSSFRGLYDLECPFRSAYKALASGVEYIELQASNGDREADEVLNHLLSLRSAARDCLLEAVREARSLALLFQRTPAASQQPLECSAGMLGGIEDLAIAEARHESEEHADTQFELGMYRSEASVVNGDAPCFSRDPLSGSLARDAHGVFVPSDIAEAEDILLQAQQYSVEMEVPQRAASRAVRLFVHANYLSVQMLDSAAEWRYRDAASIAVSQGYQVVASQSLSRLSAMLVTRSRRQEALVAASESLTHAEDPLALYLQTSLRLTSGEFSTGAAIREASKQLQGLAGKLPWEALEAQRMMLQSELSLWDALADGGVWACLGLDDVAKVLICVLGKLAF